MITNGTMNNQPAICTALQDGGSCVDLLMTLRPEDNGSQLVRELGQILNGRATGPLVHNSGGEEQIYIQVDIDEFIRNTPVE